jgi:hypothetical protein
LRGNALAGGFKYSLIRASLGFRPIEIPPLDPEVLLRQKAPVFPLAQERKHRALNMENCKKLRGSPVAIAKARLVPYLIGVGLKSNYLKLLPIVQSKNDAGIGRRQ